MCCSYMLRVYGCVFCLFLFCLYVCVCVYLQIIRSIAGVPFDSAGRLRATRLLRTTCMRSWCNWIASCVAVYQNQKLKTYDGRIVVEAARKLAPKDGENRTFDEVPPRCHASSATHGQTGGGLHQREWSNDVCATPQRRLRHELAWIWTVSRATSVRRPISSRQR